MTVSFRNVDASATDPVPTWPEEALVIALERGGVQTWRRIAAEIYRSPWGPVAREVEGILTYSQPYGTAPLMRDTIDKARRQAVASENDEVVRRIRSAMRHSGLTVGAFAELCGTSRSRMSTYLAGKVVPSSAMLVRMERVAHSGAETETAAPADQTGLRAGSGSADE